MVRAVASVDSQTKDAQQYLSTAFCFDLSWLTYVNMKLCSRNNQSQSSSESTYNYHKSCRAFGGDQSSMHINPCTPSSASSEEDKTAEFNTWLGGGEQGEGQSIYKYDLMPVADILGAMGLDKFTNQMEKAVEFHSCVAPRFKWVQADSGNEHFCKCDLTCQNYGTLNDDCTCTCRGDDYHGWSGDDCSEPYGTCQMGTNSGNPSNAANCPVNGNTCASNSWQQICKPSEVCCLTNFEGKCCPFGSSCSCGVGDCECVLPPWAASE